jgi:subtilisin family serine protease
VSDSLEYYDTPDDIIESIPSEAMILANVLFQRDVPGTTKGVATAHKHHAIVVAKLESINGLVIMLSWGNLHDLAAEDDVQWIEPAGTRLDPLNDDVRKRVGVDDASGDRQVYGLDGAGINVLVYDIGIASLFHPDLSQRVFIGDNMFRVGNPDHPTHVTGTIGGDGVFSGGVFVGMAPNVNIVSFGTDTDILMPGAFGTDLVDLITDYKTSISTHLVVIANNSIGKSRTDCNDLGTYSAFSKEVDAIVHGSLTNGKSFRVVWAIGNERLYTAPEHRCDDRQYDTLILPTASKNPVGVGAVNSDDDTVWHGSSWGPADDGRIKPDIVAPGCQTGGDHGVTSCAALDPDLDFYWTSCGTSFAAPTVTGIGALLLQD